ncbi:hypothetical protein EDB83DRAFT_2320656 [Lactarius deliciosus]|nr:hypothetical protein EDB83DRAFT_2320656 [Lactarius deliciosus]
MSDRSPRQSPGHELNNNGCRWQLPALRGLSTGQTLKYFEMNVGFAGKRASISRVLQDQRVITENQRATGFFVVPNTAGVSDLRYEHFWNHWRNAVVPYLTKDDAEFVWTVTWLGPPRFTFDSNT